MVQTCIFDLYGTLVDIHTDEEKPEVWKKLALFFRYYGADYTPAELKEAYSFQVQKLTEMFREEQEKQAGNEKDGRLEKENGNGLFPVGRLDREWKGFLRKALAGV